MKTAILLRSKVIEYVCPSPKATMYFLEDSDQRVYAAVSIPNRQKEIVRVVVMAREINDHVVIDTDITDRPLYETLLQDGLAREQIILAYQGEEIPS